MEDLRGEIEIVNSKSEEEEDENECDGDDGSVCDFVESFTLFFVLFPISYFFAFSISTSIITAQYFCTLSSYS